MSYIYILTYHCASNVGAMLQCYALSTAIRKLGDIPIIIDYRPKSVIMPAVEKYFWWKKKHPCYELIRRKLQYIYRYVKYYRKKELGHFIFEGDTNSAFCNFMTQRLRLTSTVYYSENDLQSLEDKDGIYIVGSDQVWNPSLSGTPKVYLLDFVKNGNKNSYAASFGSKEISKDFSILLNQHLRDFKNITVREDSGVSIVRQYAGKDAVCVVDPVFLLEKKAWSSLVYKVTIKEPYIFVYRMENNDSFSNHIKRIKKEYNINKVVQFDYIKGGIIPDYVVRRKGPIDFISYLMGSHYVITNSFHGTAFSIIAQKDAIIIPHSSLNERIESLMKIVGVELDKNNNVYKLKSGLYKRMTDSISFSKMMLRKICNNESEK